MDKAQTDTVSWFQKDRKGVFLEIQDLISAKQSKNIKRKYILSTIKMCY